MAYKDIKVEKVDYTSTIDKYPCNHDTGWYVTVKFWIFSKRIFVCSNCGHHYEVKK